jgi:peptidoglycan/LPS O-acetylase OafA/YrhL
MWLPTPIYERLPIFWVVLGLLFIAGGLYIGSEISPALGYITVGIACFFAGVAVAGVRAKYRRDKAANSGANDSDKPLAQ